MIKILLAMWLWTRGRGVLMGGFHLVETLLLMAVAAVVLFRVLPEPIGLIIFWGVLLLDLVLTVQGKLAKREA